MVVEKVIKVVIMAQVETGEMMVVVSVGVWWTVEKSDDDACDDAAK